MNALRRVAWLARATAKDLFAGQSVALACLALAGFALWGDEPRSMKPGERHAIELRQRVQLFATLATAAAVLAAAHVVSEDRRRLVLARLATTPLTAFEALAGRTLGVLGGVAAVALPVEVALLLAPQSGLVAQRELFAPRAVVAPGVVELTQPDGARLRWRRGPALLEGGAHLCLRFAVADASRFALELPIAAALGDAPSEPATWVLEIEGREVARGAGIRGDLTVLTLPPGADGELGVVLRCVSGTQVLRVEPAECRLRGPPGSITASVVRACAGLLALLLLGSALAAALATALPDALAWAASGALLLLASLRSLFVDAAAALGDLHAHPGAITRVAAAAIARLLAILPDAARASAAEPIALGAQPWTWRDAAALGLALGYALLAWLLGSLWLRRTRGGA